MTLVEVSTFGDTGNALMNRAAEGGVTVDLDLSLFVQLGLFLVLLFILKPTLFDPLMRLIEEREKRIEGVEDEARKLDIKSTKSLEKYDALMAKARDAGGAERDALRTEGQKREQEILAQVRAEVAATLERGRAEIAAEAKAARATLDGEAKSLGREAASRVLGREVSA